MSAPAPHLALVPATPPRAPQSASRPNPATIARFRRVFLGTAFVGTALPPLATLLGPFIGPWRVAAYVLCFVALVPVSALVLGIELLVSRTVADLRACLTGLLALAGCVMLTAQARDAGVELFVASHQAELDRLAVDVHAFQGAMEARQARRDSVSVETANRFYPREHALGVTAGDVQDGAVAFHLFDGSDDREIVYAFGGVVPGCGPGSVRFLGGRWFLRRCRRPDAD